MSRIYLGSPKSFLSKDLKCSSFKLFIFDTSFLTINTSFKYNKSATKSHYKNFWK